MTKCLVKHRDNLLKLFTFTDRKWPACCQFQLTNVVTLLF